jgi:branched-chain amino acid transport system permease protein
MDWQTLGQQVWNGTLIGGLYVLFASGISLTFGVMRVVNMAHGELAMLGAMLLYVLSAEAGLNIWLSIVLSLLASGVIGVGVNRIAVRPVMKKAGNPVLMVLVATLALSIVLMEGSFAVLHSDTRAVERPFEGVIDAGGVRIDATALLVVAIAGIALFALYLFLMKTRFGRMARATGENALGSRVVGINTNRVFDQTFFVGSVLAALAGIGVILTSDVTPAMGQPLLLIGFATVIVAGMGSIKGAVIVGLGFGITGALFQQYVSTAYSEAYIYAVMILVLLVRPHGIFGERRASPLIAR